MSVLHRLQAWQRVCWSSALLTRTDCGNIAHWSDISLANLTWKETLTIFWRHTIKSLLIRQCTLQPTALPKHFVWDDGIHSGVGKSEIPRDYKVPTKLKLSLLKKKDEHRGTTYMFVHVVCVLNICKTTKTAFSYSVSNWVSFSGWAPFNSRLSDN